MHELVHSSGEGPNAVTEPLILDFLAWLAPVPRAYAEVMEAWRTSCPRLTIWEDAVDGGYVVRRRLDDRVFVELTPQGRRRLKDARVGSGRQSA